MGADKGKPDAWAWSRSTQASDWAGGTEGLRVAEKEATFIRKLKKWRGDARLYKLNPPLPVSDVWAWNDDEELRAYEYIVVSSVSASWGIRNETMIFAAT